MRHASPQHAAAVGLIGTLASVCAADVIEFEDKNAWEVAVGTFTTIDFTGFPGGTFITDQYADLGVLFNDGDDNIRYLPSAFPNDDWGLDGNWGIHLTFSEPMMSIAVDFPDGMQFELYREGGLIYTSSEFGSTGVGFFAGLVSTEPFDEVFLDDWDPRAQVFIDDLHFGPPIPAPSALALLAAGLLAPRRRRK